jgi:hypothetical protein
VGFPPLLNALDVVGSAEVVAVGPLAQPTALAGCFAGPATRFFSTEVLVSYVTVIRSEELFATPAFATLLFAAHPEPKPEG